MFVQLVYKTITNRNSGGIPLKGILPQHVPFNNSNGERRSDEWTKRYNSLSHVLFLSLFISCLWERTTASINKANCSICWISLQYINHTRHRCCIASRLWWYPVHRVKRCGYYVFEIEFPLFIFCFIKYDILAISNASSFYKKEMTYTCTCINYPDDRIPLYFTRPFSTFKRATLSYPHSV